MNVKWQEFLIGEGAVLEGGEITGFSSSAEQARLESGANMLAALTDLGVVRVSGADACTFLQAHFTNDVAALAEGSTQLSAYCSPKGRLLAIFTVLHQADAYFLVMPREVIESVLKRLNMFAMMARPAGKQLIGKAVKTAVQLADVSDQYMVLGVQSVRQAQKVSARAFATFAALSKAVEDDRFYCLATSEAASEIWSELNGTSVPVSGNAWRLANIRAGLPEIVQATQESFVPQMTNLHLLDGISFTKGCYPGQEIVARMQYLGTLKRRMQRFSVEATSVLPGTALCAGDDQAAGVVVQAAGSEEAGVSELLAVIKISAASKTLTLETAAGAPLKGLELPYDFQVNEASA